MKDPEVSQAELEIVRQYFAAWNEDGLEGAAAYWTPGFEWHDATELPDAGVYRGRDAVAAHFGELGATLGGMEVDVLELTPVGAEILAALNVHVDTTLGGVSIDGPIYETIRIERCKLARIRLFLEREQALAALEAGHRPIQPD